MLNVVKGGLQRGIKERLRMVFIGGCIRRSKKKKNGRWLREAKGG